MKGHLFHADLVIPHSTIIQGVHAMSNIQLIVYFDKKNRGFIVQNQLSINLHLCFIPTYRISGNSFRGNYSFLEVGVWQVFKGGNYIRKLE